MKRETVPAARRLLAVYEELRRVHGRARGVAVACEDLGNWRQVQMILGRKAQALRLRMWKAKPAGGQS